MDAGADVNASAADTGAAEADAADAADSDAADADAADDADIENEAGGRPMVKGVDGEAEAHVLNR